MLNHIKSFDFLSGYGVNRPWGPWQLGGPSPGPLASFEERGVWSTNVSFRVYFIGFYLICTILFDFKEFK